MIPPAGGGFEEWRVWIIREMERLANAVEVIDRRSDGHDVSLAIINTKAAILGLLGGALVTAIAQWLFRTVAK